MDKKDIINRIGYFRTLKNLSARELSIKLGNNNSYITRMESGEFNLTIEKFLEILQILEIEPVQFFADNYNSYDVDKKLEANLNKLTVEDKKLVELFINRLLTK